MNSYITRMQRKRKQSAKRKQKRSCKKRKELKGKRKKQAKKQQKKRRDNIQDSKAVEAADRETGFKGLSEFLKNQSSNKPTLLVANNAANNAASGS
ncbi:hypothetical protein OS493_009052 [Desmophyllum pertusum]|uniref:Uncharacterized protein n=1 Tax=Desmophyllum pertusum TaxID=174260 RepID=A0A9W9ZFN7_9CNID|nr:hypothetical protein OS493_009052 [Desmophyllum pertusum]